MNESQMNELYNVLVINLFSKSKEGQKKIKHICINNFDPDIELHNFYFCVAGTSQAIWGVPIYLNMNLIKYLKWKWKVRKIYRKVHWTPFKLKGSVYPIEELNHVADANQLDNSIWYDIYNKFFLLKD